MTARYIDSGVASFGDTEAEALRQLADGREEGIYSDFSDRIARAREAGTEIIGVGVCREASLLVTLDKQRVVEHLQAVDGVVDETFALVSNRYCEVVDVVAVG